MQIYKGFQHLSSALDIYHDLERPMIQELSDNSPRSMTSMELLVFINRFHEEIAVSVDISFGISQILTKDYQLTRNKRSFRAFRPVWQINDDFALGFTTITKNIYFYDVTITRMLPRPKIVDQYNEEQKLVLHLAKRYKSYQLYLKFFLDLSLYDHFNLERDRRIPSNPYTTRALRKPHFEDYPLVSKLKQMTQELKELRKSFQSFDENESLVLEI